MKTKEKLYTEKEMYKLYKDYYHAGSDVHNMTHRGTPKERRKELNVGDIYTNAAICHVCGWFIRSKNRHDYVTCGCGNVSVDGGSWYCRRSFKDNTKITEVIELYDDAKEAKDDEI